MMTQSRTPNLNHPAVDCCIALSTRRCARKPQTGGAILAAMLTVSFVATFAIFTQWQLWRAIEIERADRAQTQQHWMLTGALDFVKMPLSMDYRTAQTRMVDHYGELMFIAPKESQLIEFLSADKNNQSTLLGDEILNGYFKGQLADAQANLNVTNLMQDGRLSTPHIQMWQRLFIYLGLPLSELNEFLDKYRSAVIDNTNKANTKGNPALLSESLERDLNQAPRPFLPTRLDQLTSLGLSTKTLNALRNYIIILPPTSSPTKININTASDVVLAASADINIAQARLLQQPFSNSLIEAQNRLGKPLNDHYFDVKSSYFLTQAQIRLDHLTLQENTLIKREGDFRNPDITVLDRERLVKGDIKFRP